jgi:hypothetical protein
VGGFDERLRDAEDVEWGTRLPVCGGAGEHDGQDRQSLPGGAALVEQEQPEQPDDQSGRGEPRGRPPSVQERGEAGAEEQYHRQYSPQWTQSAGQRCGSPSTSCRRARCSWCRW